MNRFPVRVTILRLLAAMGVIGYGCAASRYANGWWVSLTMSLLALTVGVVLLMALFRRGTVRAKAIGFLVGVIGYLTLLYAPWFSVQVGPYLVTSKLLDRMESAAASNPDIFIGRLLPSNTTTFWTADESGNFLFAGSTAARPASVILRTAFQTVAHLLLCLPFGLLFGWLSALFVAREHANQGASHADSLDPGSDGHGPDR